jgi:indole-3-glycerol phosphate synthase
MELYESYGRLMVSLLTNRGEPAGVQDKISDIKSLCLGPILKHGV